MSDVDACAVRVASGCALLGPRRRWTGVPDDNDVDDYCDKCGSVITWGSVKTVVKSPDTPDQVLCESCTEAAHREFWDGP